VILVDAGPLVALIHRDDNHHVLCRDALRSLDEPLGTVWPAFTEAAYLLGFSWHAQDALWDFVARGVLSILPLDAADAPRMRELMESYRDLPMDLADAALVRVAERMRLDRVFTLDRKDFTVYRPNGLGTFDLVP
jgi:predicted nucleic acid-binding protein